MLENKHENRGSMVVRKLVYCLESSFSSLCLRIELLPIVKLNCLDSICVSINPVSSILHYYRYSRTFE